MSLLGWMIKEEWRIHSRLFGSWGFAAFPFFIFFLTGGAFYLMIYAGYDVVRLERGLHYIVFFLGLNVGSIGFVSRDAIDNLLGESNLLVFIVRTLPVSFKRVVSVFVVKDLIYYSLLYIAPLVLGLVPITLFLGEEITNPALMWITITMAFMLGVSISFLGASFETRGRLYLFGFIAALLGLVALLQFDVLRITPLALYESVSLTSIVAATAPIVVFLLLGVIVFVPRTGSRSRSRGEKFSVVNKRVWFDDTGLVSKMIFDITRSSGGVWKVFISVGILFVLFVFLVNYVPFISSIVTSPGISFAVLLALSSISIYHWINRFDRMDNYMMLPVSIKQVIKAKFITELSFAIPIGYVYLVIGGYLFGFGEMIIGGIILPLVTLYIFGVTVYLTGVEPGQLLLNSRLFALLTVAVMIIAVPLFIGSIAYRVYPLEVIGFSLVYSGIAGGIGILLYLRSLEKWSEKLSLE